MICDAGCGVSADSADVDACVAALTSLIRDDDAVRRMGDSGRRYATDHFSKQVCVSQLEAMLEA